MTRLIPKYNTVLVLKDKVPEKAGGAIYFPAFDKYKQVEDRKVNTGTILAVGKLPDDLEYRFKKGDKVFFGVYAGVPFTYQDVQIHVMLVNEITGVFRQID